MTKFHCMGCAADFTQRPDGAIDETRTTLGGSALRITLRFPCRRLVVPYVGSDRCDGRCGGYCDSDRAWVAECSDCEDYDWDSDAGILVDHWSCFDKGCVMAWIAKSHPDCGHVEISHGSPLWRFTFEESDAA